MENQGILVSREIIYKKINVSLEIKSISIEIT